MATITTRYKGFKITTRDFKVFYAHQQALTLGHRGDIAGICYMIDDYLAAR